MQELLSRQINAEEHRDKVLKDLNRRIFAKFSEKYDMWNMAVYKLSVLDVLISLAEYALSGDMCIPEVNDGTDERVICNSLLYYYYNSLFHIFKYVENC